MACWKSYNESWGYGSPKSISKLVGILGDTTTPHPDVLQSLADALLLLHMAIGAARPGRGTPSDPFVRVISSRLPAVETRAAEAPSVYANAIGVETSRACRPSAYGSHGRRVDMVGELFEARVAFAIVVREQLAA